MTEGFSEHRSRNYLNQIKGAIAYRGLAVMASLWAIPLMIKYLGSERFGVWSTMLTVMSWIVFFDLGVGNGLRNKVSEALAQDDYGQASKFIASGYSLIGLVALVLWAFVTCVSFFVPWQVVFNTHSIPESTLRLTVQVVAFFVILNFWIGLINAILGALQKTSITALGQFISNALSLLFIFVLSKTVDAAITNLALVYGVALVTTNLGLSWWFYSAYPKLRPRAMFNSDHFKPLLTVGLQFFTIQVAVLIIFMTDKMMIIQLIGPDYVTQYEVVYKLFSLILFSHALISTPLWSAYTDAYRRRDLPWIKGMFRKQFYIFGVVVVAALLMALIAQWVINLWIGAELHVSQSLTWCFMLFVMISTWNNIYAMFVNGIGEIKIQLYTSVVAMIINIPLAIAFVKFFEMGLSGIVLATVVSLSLAAIALPIQVNKIIRARSTIVSAA